MTLGRSNREGLKLLKTKNAMYAVYINHYYWYCRKKTKHCHTCHKVPPLSHILSTPGIPPTKTLWSKTEKNTVKIGIQQPTFPEAQEWVSEWAVWANEWMAQCLRLDSWLFWTTVQKSNLGRAAAAWFLRVSNCCGGNKFLSIFLRIPCIFMPHEVF